jgi:hypothetical protein
MIDTPVETRAAAEWCYARRSATQPSGRMGPDVGVSVSRDLPGPPGSSDVRRPGGIDCWTRHLNRVPATEACQFNT